MGLTRPVFDLFGHSVSWRDMVLIGGSFFLLYKGTQEIHYRFEDDGPDVDPIPCQSPPQEAGRSTVGFGHIARAGSARSSRCWSAEMLCWTEQGSPGAESACCASPQTIPADYREFGRRGKELNLLVLTALYR
jgi:hypothetical protein